MSKDSKIRKLPPLNQTGKGECPSITIDIPDTICPPPHVSSTKTGQNQPTDKKPLSNAFGVDKLDLILQSGEFEYGGKRPPKWTEKIFENEKSRTTEYFNQNKELGYIADIKPDQPLKKGYLHISANPSKIYHDFELTNDTNKIFDFYRAVFQDLATCGVMADMSQAKISRFDLAHNILLDHDLPSYANVFDTLQGKNHFTRAYGNSRYWSNGENQFIIYPKRKELITQHKKKYNTKNLPDITRAEIRALKGRSVQKIAGVKYIGDIIGRSFVEEYNLFVSDRILREQYGTQLKFEFEYLEESLNNCILHFGKFSAFNNFLKIIGIEALASQPHGLIYLHEILRNHFNDRVVRRQMSQVNKILNIVKPNVEKHDENFFELNSELRKKLLIA